MPNNKSSAAKANNSNRGKSAREERTHESSGVEGHGNSGKNQKQNHGFKQARGNSNPFGGVKNIGGKDIKDGCFPKLFMLFLPFMAVGTFLFFKSMAS